MGACLPLFGNTRQKGTICAPDENSGLFRWTDSLTTVTYSLNSHRALSLYMLTLYSLPLFYVYMPAFPIYFDLLCGFTPSSHIARAHLVFPSISYFPPPCFCVTKYYVFSHYFTSLLRFHAIFNHIYFFSHQHSLPPSCAALFNLIYHITHHIYSLPFTHTHHHSCFVPPSFHYNLQAPTPTALRSQYP